jgi:hypothetical protein
MASATPDITESDILNQIVAPNEPTLPAESARSILTLGFNPQAIARMNELAEKNRHNALNDSERVLLENYQRVGNFLNLLQAKARLSLIRPSNGS